MSDAVVPEAANGIVRVRLEGVLGEPISHYTDAILAGGFCYISGMLATNAAGALIGAGDVVAQCEQVIDNIEAVLLHVGATLADVVKVIVYLRDVDDRPAVNVVRQRRFGDARPTSTLVEISALAHPDALIEIESIAWVPEASLDSV
ncbi:MAG: Endoribonuclease [Acidimicrobiaceae bacterium]|nr:Endoribonuclease [Acidimicrobiaceae bacterium]